MTHEDKLPKEKMARLQNRNTSYEDKLRKKRWPDYKIGIHRTRTNCKRKDDQIAKEESMWITLHSYTQMYSPF